VKGGTMKNDWFKQEKKEFFKKPKKSKDDFTPERSLKLAGSMVLTAGAILAGTKMIKAIGDA
jgi:hypothetical protein